MSDCSMHVQKGEKQQRNQFPRGRVENGTFYSLLKGKLEGCLMGVATTLQAKITITY